MLYSDFNKPRYGNCLRSADFILRSKPRLCYMQFFSRFASFPVKIKSSTTMVIIINPPVLSASQHSDILENVGMLQSGDATKRLV